MSKRPSLPPTLFEQFPNYETIRHYCERLRDARPELCALGSLGPSREGRDVLLLTVTDQSSGSPEDKPAYLVHAAIHGDELAGIVVALYSARQLLADYDSNPDLLRRLTFYIVPSLNPDAADLAARYSMPLRSRWDRSDKQPNTLYIEDVNNDGNMVQMRQEHPDGNHFADPADTRLMRPRRVDSKGPFYRIWPEGFVHDYDGDVHRVRVEHRSLDWNRQWAHGWQPEHIQRGSGDFPFSEPEMRHIARFLHERHNLTGAVGYHTGPTTLFRPPSIGPITTMDAGDHQLYNEIGRVGSDLTGFPLSPVTEWHAPHKPPNRLQGHFGDFGYHHLGLVVFEYELGLIYDSVGFGPYEQRDFKTEDEQIDMNRALLRWWEAQPEAQREPLWLDWQPFDHPQLGKVEIGGFLVRHQYNQTLKQLEEIAPKTHQFCVHHAQCAPRLVVEQLAVEDMGARVRRIRLSIANRGRLATSITSKGQSLKRMHTVRASLRPGDGVSLLSRSAHVDLGHLDGVTGIGDLEWFVRLESERAPQPLAAVEIRGGTAGNMSITCPAAADQLRRSGPPRTS